MVTRWSTPGHSAQKTFMSSCPWNICERYRHDLPDHGALFAYQPAPSDPAFRGRYISRDSRYDHRSVRRYRYGLLGCTDYHDNCTDNLIAGMRQIGLMPPEVPSPLNLWMNIPVAPDGKTGWASPSPNPATMWCCGQRWTASWPCLLSPGHPAHQQGQNRRGALSGSLLILMSLGNRQRSLGLPKRSRRRR